MLPPDTLRRNLLLALATCALTANAGDLLRGGAATMKRNPTSASDAATASATEALRSNAKDSLARTTNALNAIRAMQAAARAAALSGANNLGADPNHPGLTLPDVPDGLIAGGLEVDPATATNAALWTGASQPEQSGGTVNITQTNQQAVLNWRTFNVGKNTTVNFDQSAGGAQAGEWIAFNKVNDPSGSPSQILGSITAQGQVYLINQNGIIFGGSSQVNVHTLVASSLPINDNLITRGLLNNPDAQFLFSSIALPAGSKGTPAFTPPAASTPDGRSGDVVVQPGAQITAPTTADHVGGRVALVGPNVTNAGTISTPDGQTILAAGLQVGFDAHSTSDASLRGLDVYIGAVTDAVRGEYAGTATNAGLIEVFRGNATIAGKTVNQLGGIDSTTSVSLNGRIDLLASYDAVTNTRYDATNPVFGLPFLNRSTGTITLGAGSVMQILPEWSSAEQTVGTKLPLQSQVNIQGRNVHLGADSTLLAPNAKVAVSAGVWDYIQTIGEAGSTFVRAGGQIYAESGAMINVAGSTDITVALAEYLLSVELRGAELADAPVQRDGVLRGPTLTVDLRQTGTYNGKTWYGTPLADLSGYVGLIQRTAGELTAEGGTVSLSAGESVVLQPGAVIDVSGGFLNHAGGFVQTTRVLQGGRLVDVAQATPDQIYDGIYTGQFTTGSSRWGVTETYSVPWMSGRHYEQSYVQGAAGGTIDIAAPAMALDGTLRGNTVAGPKQRTELPKASALSLSFEARQIDRTNLFPLHSPTPPDVTFISGASAAAADAFKLDEFGVASALRADRKEQVVLSPELLTKDGFGFLTVVNSDGNIIVPENVDLKAPAGGGITLSGKNISILGKVEAPGGKLSFSVYSFSPYQVADLRLKFGTEAFVNPTADPARGTFTLGGGASLSAAGLIVDDRLEAPAPFTLPVVTKGGSVTINTFNADLAAGSVIDVSGGVVVNATGKRSYGDAGSIAIKAGQDLNLLGIVGGRLNLGATLKGYSGAKGGSLTLQAPLVQIGGSALNADTLLLQPEFFSQGGFTQFTLQGFGARVGGDVPADDEPAQFLPGVYIAPGTVIEPVAESLVAFINVRGNDSVEMRRVVKPVDQRTPVSLTFSAAEARDEFDAGVKGQLARGDVVLAEGAVIRTDPMATVTLRGQTVAVLGSIHAPSGVIQISGATNSTAVFNDLTQARTTVYIGPDSRLSTAGTTVRTLNQWGNNTGYVLPGGTIHVSGNIVAAAGAVLDVSGASDVVDVPPAYLNLDATLQNVLNGKRIVPLTSGLTSPLYASLVVPTRIDSDGGTINLKGGQMLFTDATLLGEAGGPTAVGGTLNVSSGRFYSTDAPATPVDVNLTITQSGTSIPAPLPANQTAIGKVVVDAKGDAIQGQGWFASDTFARGGFDSLSLGGVVKFSGPVTIDARQKLSVADGGVIYADDVVSLSAPYVKLGQSFHIPYQAEEQVIPFSNQTGAFYFTPTHGTGSLNVRADLIDIGNLSLQNIGSASLYAKNDIRGNGTFNIAGNLLLTAGQIYPTTASAFTITAYDHIVNGATQPGSVSIAWSGVQRDLPLSAGGQLNVFASIINQGGVLRAPIGSINLGWDGTGTPPVNPIAGAAPAAPMPVTQQLTLAAGSITSVSAVNSVTGEATLIPYGIVQNGTGWIDPTGRDITAGGIVGKSVSLSASGVTTEAGSLIDISGGGDLLAYTWVKGNGGTTDVLASDGSFAVIPGYDSNFSPYAPFGSAEAFVDDAGYVNDTLQVGDRIFLGGSSALRAGTYTLLPARYALLPGAVLVTPQSGQPVGTFQNPDGSSYVSGYRFNDLNSSREATSLYSRFEVAPASVVNQRSEYKTYFANTFLKESALKLDSPVPRLPIDGGYLLFQSTQAMSLRGDVYGYSTAGGRGGVIDISTPIDIVIGGVGAPDQGGKLVLDSSLVSRWGAESLLVGGSRTFGVNGTNVKVVTGNITVDNAGTPLSGAEIILAATRTLTLEAGSHVEQSGTLGGAADLLIFGDAAVAGSGNGTMLRVTSDPKAEIFRNSVTVPDDFPGVIVPKMTIGAGATITGEGIILDSTYATSLDASASILGNAISLNSGRISIQFENPGALQPTVGLVLAGSVLQGLQSAQSLSLLSYTSIDLYGTGTFASAGKLALHAGAIRGLNSGGGIVSFNAGDITLDNSASAKAPAAAGALSGTLVFNGDTIRLGQGTLAIQQYAALALNASGGVIVKGSGSLSAPGAVTVTAPLITAEKSASHGITAGGDLALIQSGTTASVEGGLGASLSFKGAGVTATTDIMLPSGLLKMQALSGPLVIGGRLDVGGTAQTFYDVVQYTDAGQVTLSADNGSVQITSGAVINVAGQAGGGDAGTLTVSAPKGAFVLGGGVFGQGGAGGLNGSFNLDAGSLASFSTLNAVLNEGVFTESRSIRLRTGDVVIDGVSRARSFVLSADAGSITVTGAIDASGTTGGNIDLKASGSVTLSAGAILNVSAQTFSNAGKGGSVYLEGGSEINGVINTAARVDIQTGSVINLTVASNTTTSAMLGQFTGTLHIRAPQVSTGNEIQINPINGTITGASKIEVEGYKLFDLTGTSGVITNTANTGTQALVKSNGITFGNAAAAITARILANNAGLSSVLVVMPGAEIINRNGNLTLGTTSSTSTSDWNLATYRSGTKSAPGVLTLKASGDLVFYNALTDGFTSSAYTSALLAYNPLLPANAQSWSYRLTAGADFSAADFHSVLPASTTVTTGSLLLGKNGGLNMATAPGAGATTSSAVSNLFQVIRTGTGDIDISARRDVQLLNQFATIYTAGVQVTDPTLGGTFDTPRQSSLVGSVGSLGNRQQNPNYPAQYTMAGGDITIHAQRDIVHYTKNTAGVLIADSERQMPVNWLYRRGYVDPATGLFGSSRYANSSNSDVASTTWWVDFSNFFEGIGALGGGDVTLIAGNNITNVDAVIPTNARMKGKDASGKAISADAANLIELGGGDLMVRAGNNIDAGVYYVERGNGTLSAGGSIVTNSTRSPSTTNLTNSAPLDSSTWLPTTLYLGKGSFDVSARGDVLMGPVVNAFLLPQGYSNTYWYKTYFSTYAATDAVSISSLGGNLTLRTSVTLPSGSESGTATPTLLAWFDQQLRFGSNPATASFYQPWLRLVESNVSPFTTGAQLLPPTVNATAFSGDINLAGDLTLSPSPTGSINLIASGAINGLQPTGVTTINGRTVTQWSSARINLSDASPASIPGITTPFAYQTLVGTSQAANVTQSVFLDFLNKIFAETGSSIGQAGVIQTKQTLHAAGPLHANDFNPVRLYAGTGSISGLTLFSGKSAQIFAGKDITDISLYVQNVRESDVTVIASGRDIVAYNPSSPLRVKSNATGNLLTLGEGAEAGDIQISGPGTLEVLAGRNLDLGVGPNNPDGTGLGIVSIGNARNPFLPFEGADIIVGAGLGGAFGFNSTKLDFDRFIADFIIATSGARYLSELTDPISSTSFAQLPVEEQRRRALEVFFLVLRDAGRDHTADGSNYDAGFKAISTLFPGTGWTGDISLTSREIKTRSGGDISVLAPGGKLSVGVNQGTNQALDQGILTEHGGSISIFANGNVDLGTSRIFTLRGGNITIWSSAGDIAAGAASKTVQSAPPTRVIIDPQSGNVQTDLAGLATGGGIGVLDTVVGVPPGNVDLIAPVGVIDAGDAGIRSSGNLNIAATAVLNASNISVAGTSSGTPAAPVVSAPNIGGLASAATAGGQGSSAAEQAAKAATKTQTQPQAERLPSIINVEVLGYGGGEGEDDEERRKKQRSDSPR